MAKELIKQLKCHLNPRYWKIFMEIKLKLDQNLKLENSQFYIHF